MITIFKKTSRPAVLYLLAFVLALSAFATRLGGASFSSVTVDAAGPRGNTLSMVEINNNFGTMVLRATMNKTLIYVERLYFDYSPLSSKRLAVTVDEETDYVVIDLVNEANEWAKVWGYVRHENGIRPDDPMLREMDLTYLEINQYWEWRTFTNDERWRVTVNDGYNTVDFTFDLNDRKDGAIYHIDGVYGLPEHYYPQVAYWWDLNSANPELVEIHDDYRARAIEAAAVTPEGEPLRLDPVEYKGKGISTASVAAPVSSPVVSPMAASSVPLAENEQQVEQTFFLTVLFVSVIVVMVAAVCVSSAPKDLAPETTPSNIIDPYDPAQRNEFTPPAPTTDQQEEYNEYVEELWADMTEEEQAQTREELEKRKEFSLDNDAPAGQKIVKLKVKDADGVLQPVYDENGDEVYVNRRTYTVGNATYALITRDTFLCIRWWPSTMELKDMVGNRLTVNADNKVMNMDGVQPYSPKSRDDILRKLGDMGMYTSAVDPARMLYRMDDDNVLIRAMNLKENEIKKGFFATIGAAFKNLFSGGGTSKGFLSNLLDVLILIGVVVIGAVLLFFLIKFSMLLVNLIRGT
ncbi:MAG: hypothetical protein FWE62_01700 [Firmicutes bacterium]|nr:hypothetical protein [Bacillota bacterium]